MLKIDDNNGITLTRGDSAELTLTLTDASGNPYDFSADTVRFGVKRSPLDTSESVLIKTFTNGKITFEPADTEGMDFGDYRYDIEVITEAGAVYTPIAAARFTIGYNVL